MRANEFINETVTPSELNQLKHYLVNQFGHLGFDFRFGQHFYDRVNDARNGKAITIGELTRLFRKTLQAHGHALRDLSPSEQVVLQDLATKINVPVVKEPEDQDDTATVVAKTVMRKRGFMTSNRVFAIEQEKQ